MAEATEGSGSKLDFLQAVEANQYLTVAASETAPGSDSDPFWFVLDGPGDENYVLYNNPGNFDFGLSAGYNADTTSQSVNGTYNDAGLWSVNYGEDFEDASYDAEVAWWLYQGTNWCWFVVTVAPDNDLSNRILGFGWQDVNQFWPYHEIHNVGRVAVMCRSDDDNSDGWFDDASLAKIDGNGSADVVRDQQLAHPMIGSVAEANSWRAQSPNAVMKRRGGWAPAGTVDAWGVDMQESSVVPEHQDNFDAGGKTFEYIRPQSARSWADYPMFFRVG